MLGKHKTQINLLELVPEKNRDWVTAEDGTTRILSPKFGDTALGSWISGRMSTPHMYIKLDEIGSAIWRACDGKNTVYDISRKLEAEFGAKVDPVYERLSLFFRELERSKFIRWKNLQE